MEKEFRIPVADAYARALGRAAYNFSYLEWGIVWLGETLSPGYLKRVQGLTAGNIARDFQKFAQGSQETDAGELQTLATSFIELVRERNSLLHGVPYTAQGGEQRLRHLGPPNGRDWTVEKIIEAANLFEENAILATRLLHSGRYAAYTAATGKLLSI